MEIIHNINFGDRNMIKKELKKYYELFISLLALIVSVISVCEVNLNLSVNTLKIFNIINSVVWIIFTVDYFTRLILTKEKLEFIKTHKIDFISILPFTPFLRSLRIINIFRVKDIARIIRFTSYIYKFKERISNILFIDKYKNVLLLTVIVIFIGAGCFSIVERIPFSDALWYSIVTVTTVGYGDIIPTSILGRLIGGIIMLSGIGAVGSLISTFTIHILENNKRKKPYEEIVVDELKNRLDDFNNLTCEDLNTIHEILLKLKQKEINERGNSDKI